MIRRMMMAGLNNGGGGEPVLLRTIKIKLDKEGFTNTLAEWNWWDEDPLLDLLTSTGAATAIKLVGSGGTWDRENTTDLVLSDANFPEGVFKSIVYTSGGPSVPKLFTVTGLDDTKTYVFRFAAGYLYSDPTDSTDVTVEGVTQLLGVTLGNTLYAIEFTDVTSTGGEVSFSIQPSVGAVYGLIDAMIIEEYSN